MGAHPGLKSMWCSLDFFERLTLISTVLIWTGVGLFGFGLYIALRNHRVEQAAYAESTASYSWPTAAVTPSPAPLIFPAGWSTATPTPIPVRPSPTITQPVGLVTRAARWVTPTPPAALRPASAHRVLAKTNPPPPASGPPDRIVIPAIHLDSPIVPIGWYVIEEGGQQQSVWQVADDVVGWHKTSAYPGHSGNVVLNGHHNIRGEVFRYLINLEARDPVVVYAEDQAYHYIVTEKHILREKGEPPKVRRQNAEWIGPTGDERLTMVTCWPYTNNTHRLVIVAKPVPPPDSGGLEP